jgi:hypothetical protein
MNRWTRLLLIGLLVTTGCSGEVKEPAAIPAKAAAPWTVQPGASPKETDKPAMAGLTPPAKSVDTKQAIEAVKEEVKGGEASKAPK